MEQEFFVMVNDNEVRLSVSYVKGAGVQLYANYITTNEFGYSYDPFTAQHLTLYLMARRNQKKIDKICAMVEENKDIIASLYTENKLSKLAITEDFNNIYFS